MDFPSAQDAISSALVDTVRSVSDISAHDLSYHRSFDPSLVPALDRQNARLLSLAERLIRSASSSASVRSPALPDAESVEDNWSSIVDVADSLFERTDACLDEFSGLRKNGSPRQHASSPAPRPSRSKLGEAFRTQNLPKPQLLFEHPPDNYADPPFRPILSRKPHSTTLLEDSLLTSRNEHGMTQYQNPYGQEIQRYRYPPTTYEKREPISYSPFESTTATFVDDLDKLYDMVKELKQASEVAIDLEHHDMHSYVGIVCLMQISTRDRDWIVDTLKPWRRKLEILNEVFTDPSIVKVLHGASMDIIWLQRDFGLYIVGLFDTYAAARSLGFPSHGLAYLLKHYVNVDAQKQYQLADWRIRPLPTELFDYARSDTHFLLYIYDCLCNELVARSNFEVEDGDKIEDVLQNSIETALQRYEHPISSGSTSDGWYKALQRNPAMAALSPQQIAAFRDIYHWRDAVARREDESVFTVLPGYVISNIVSAMPKDVPSLLAVSHPISTYLRERSSEIVKLIRDAAGSGGLSIPGKKSKSSRIAQAAPVTSPESLSSLSNPSTPQSAPVDYEAHSRVTSDWSVPRMDSSRFWGSISSNMLACSLVDNRGSFDDTMVSLHTRLVPSHPAQLGREASLMDISEPQPSPVGHTAPFDLDGGRSNGLDHSLADTDSPVVEIRPDGSRPGSSYRVTEHEHLEVQKKAARKAAKKANKTEPYDYESAPSMLHSKSPVSQPAKQRAPYNPYVMAAQAPAGSKRAYKPEPGRSATFKP